jgi:CHAT domain-containing protein
MEFSLGGLGDVVRPKPISVKKELKENDVLKKTELYIRELLQVMARNPIGKSIADFSGFVVSIGKGIYEFLPNAIRDSLWSMGEGSLLTLELDDNLVGLPWELAFNGSEFLCTRFGIGRIIYSENVHLEKRQPRQQTRVLIISNPDDKLREDTEKVALPIKKKLEKLGAIVDHMCYHPGSTFHTSKGNILDVLGSGFYDIVHFAAHGRYDERFPEKSCFALADGELLFADEISERMEKAVRSGKEAPFLFYADSCEAGAQKGWDMRRYRSQVLGLAEALIRYNVAYIGAFWSANIVASRTVALSFYEALLDRKEPLGAALRNAKLAVWNSPELGPNHPNCEWANFALYGDPSLTIKI